MDDERNLDAPRMSPTRLVHSCASSATVVLHPLAESQSPIKENGDIAEKEIAYAGGAEEAIARDESESDDFPDGGLRAWVVLAGGVAMATSSFGYVNTWGIWEAYYQETILPDVSPSTISWIGSLQYSLTFLPGLVAGRMFDLGFFRIPLLVSSLLVVILTFVIAECTQYWHFLLVQGVAQGLACGFMFGPTTAAVGHWFKKRRSLAFGLIAVGSSIGGTTFPIVASRLLPQVGFPWTMRIFGFILLAITTFGNLTLRRRLPPVRVAGGLVNPAAFKNMSYTYYTMATCITFLGLFTALTYLNLSAVQVGLPRSFSIYLTAIANGSSAFGRLSAGAIADHTGPINIIIPFSLVTAAATLAWPYCTTQPSVIGIAILYGFASGAYSALFAAPVAAMGPPEDMGRRIGMMFTLCAFFAVCGPPIAGAISTRYGSFHQVGVYAACMILLSMLLLLLSKRAALGTLFGKF